MLNVSKASRMLGFVYRTTKSFKDNTVLLTLYKSLVRSRLEYCSSIWSPSQQYLIDKIERVQKRLVRWLCYRDGLDYDSSILSTTRITNKSSKLG